MYGINNGMNNYPKIKGGNEKTRNHIGPNFLQLPINQLENHRPHKEERRIDTFFKSYKCHTKCINLLANAYGC
jgi:hypothetical protein